MSELYRLFALEFGSHLDYSDEALLSLYNHESYGTDLTPHNGYAVGKKYLNVQVSMWREDLRNGVISRRDLYDDDRFPHDWLDSVLKDLWKDLTYEDILTISRVG